MEKIKKRLAVVLVAMVALCVGTALIACSSGKSAEEVIRADISAQLDPFKDLDRATVDELAEGIEDAELGDYGVSSQDFVASMLDGFDYSVDSVEVAEDGGTASASVSVTCKTFTDVLSRIEELSVDLVSGGEVAAMTETELNARLGELMMQAVDEAEAKPSVCEFGYTRSDEGWTIDGDAESEIYNAFFV